VNILDVLDLIGFLINFAKSTCQFAFLYLMQLVPITAAQQNLTFLAAVTAVYLFCKCFRRHSFQPVNCNIISRVQSLQATMMLAYWTLVYCM